jgi:MFS family permease
MELGLTKGGSQILLAIFLIGYTFGFLPYGPMANWFGRRKTSMYAVLFAIFGATLSMIGFLLKDISSLYIGRLICGLGSSVGLKMAFTYISEVYPPSETAGRIAYMSLSFALGPSLAVLLGGFLTSHIGAGACFVSILFYAICMLGICFQLPETLKEENKTPLVFSNIAKGYTSKFKNHVLILAAILLGASTTFVYIFASFAPFIGIKVIGLTPKQYGYLNLIPSLGMIGGFFVTRYMKSKISPFSQLLTGIVIAGVFSLAMFLCFVGKLINIYTLFLFAPGVYLGKSIVFTNSSSIAISSAEDKANASAITSFINMLFCSTVLLAANLTKSEWVSFLPSVFLLLILGMGILVIPLKKKLKLDDRVFCTG